ncbi:OmpH family outer membrane protein [Parasphingorhabdus sp.]|jgi:Skp family chaperone for outer membrane proteins|uniref:OmpH family outer membrane protein n=1 Tax=Parasphingorhabdus sp. TaxID=2709688 RepID=UPI003001F522
MTKISKTILKSAAVAMVAMTAPALMSVPAIAQSKSGIAMANYPAAMAKSQAYTVAMTQMQTTYKADIDAINARAAALQTEMKPIVDAYNTAVQKPGATAQSVQPQAQALQTKQQSAKQELSGLRQRIDLATAYVEEQIALKLEAAVKATMKTKNVDLVLSPDAVVAREPHVDITDAIVLELNKLVPSVSITPPAGWEPGKANQPQQPPAAQPASR